MIKTFQLKIQNELEDIKEKHTTSNVCSLGKLS